MVQLKKNFYWLLTFIFLITGCASYKQTIALTPNITLPQRDPSLMGVTISINSIDLHPGSAIAKLNHDGKLILLTPERDPRFLLLEALEKQMHARGYMIGTGSSIPHVTITLDKLYADVNEGNFRHRILTVAQVTVSAKLPDGHVKTKSYQTEYQQKGAFSATLAPITKSINLVLDEIFKEMAKDPSIHLFIKQHAREKRSSAR